MLILGIIIGLDGKATLIWQHQSGRGFVRDVYGCRMEVIMDTSAIMSPLMEDLAFLAVILLLSAPLCFYDVVSLVGFFERILEFWIH